MPLPASYSEHLRQWGAAAFAAFVLFSFGYGSASGLLVGGLSGHCPGDLVRRLSCLFRGTCRFLGNHHPLPG
jgi:hypothetical protein